MKISRGALLGTTSAVASSAAVLTTGIAVAEPGKAAAPLPARSEFVVRHARVLTMDAALGDLVDADVHVRNGQIVAVGKGLRAPGVAAIDGRAMIAMPGMIDAHNHIWNTPERSLVRESAPGKGYFPVTLALGKAYTPTDTYRGVLLGVAEMLSSGITTVNDWSHNLRTPAHAEADLRALRDAGIRARFSYGTWQGGPPADQPMDTTHLAQLAREWPLYANGGLLTLGMASRSISKSPRGPANLNVLAADWDAARKLGLPITIHSSGSGGIATLEREHLLGPDLQLVAAVGWTADELDAVARARSTVCISPSTDDRMSFGNISLQELRKRNIITAISCDTAGVTGYLNLFEEMRLVYAQQSALAHDDGAITPQQLLEFATMDGARALGIADRTGSLTPGKRADLILIRTTDLNMAPVLDPREAIVRSALPSNVDTVVVDGRVLKRGGRLTALDAAQIATDATDTLKALLARSGLS